MSWMNDPLKRRQYLRRPRRLQSLPESPGFWSPKRKCFIPFEQIHEEAHIRNKALDALPLAERLHIYEFGRRMPFRQITSLADIGL